MVYITKKLKLGPKSSPNHAKKTHRDLNHLLIERIFESKNQKVISIRKYYSNQNSVYRVHVGDKYYVVKLYSHAAINSKADRDYREEQLKYAEALQKRGVNVILPIKQGKHYIKRFEDYYYSISEEFKTDNSFNLENLVKLFEDSHDAKIKCKLESHYKYITLSNPFIQQLVDDNNLYVYKTEDLIVAHNDFKPLNVLWRDGQPYLVDFDAVSLSNKTACLMEMAINFSRRGRRLDYVRLRKIFDLYFENHEREDFDMVFNLALNSKLSLQEFLVSSNNADASDGYRSLRYFLRSKNRIRACYMGEQKEKK